MMGKIYINQYLKLRIQMSKQYQNFKQTFISRQYSQYQQSGNKFNTNEINLDLQNHQSDGHLTIQQQSHYPFQQLQQGENFDALTQPQLLERGSKRINMGLNQINQEDEKYQRERMELRRINEGLKSLKARGGFEKSAQQEQNQNAQLAAKRKQPNSNFQQYLGPNYFSSKNNPNSHQLNSNNPIQTDTNIKPQQQFGSSLKSHNNIQVGFTKNNTPSKQLPIIYASPSSKSQPHQNLVIREQFYSPCVINPNQLQGQLVVPLSQHLANEKFIPLHEYERLRAQSAMWQQKCVQQQSVSNTEQMRRLREQNARLLERIIQFESAYKLSIQKIQQGYQITLQKYQQSLTKQAELLLDRCRLEMKQNQRQRFQAQDKFYK